MPLILDSKRADLTAAPKRGYVDALEDRVQHLESLLKALSTGEAQPRIKPRSTLQPPRLAFPTADTHKVDQDLLFASQAFTGIDSAAQRALRLNADRNPLDSLVKALSPPPSPASLPALPDNDDLVPLVSNFFARNNALLPILDETAIWQACGESLQVISPLFRSLLSVIIAAALLDDPTQREYVRQICAVVQGELTGDFPTANLVQAQTSAILLPCVFSSLLFS